MTRRSRLALWQAMYVRDTLIRAHSGIDVEILGMTTEGDRALDSPLSERGGKGLFIKELDQAVLAGRVDIAVHSMKDVTASIPEGLSYPVICERGDSRDALVSNRWDNLWKLPKGATVGTSSLRRQAWLRFRFPNLKVQNVRGNVDTRLKCLDNGEFDAIILAAAGLKRLDLTNRIQQFIPTDTMLPAVGQGAVGIGCRSDDFRIHRLLKPLDHVLTHVQVKAERAAAKCLDGNCQVPMAAHAQITGKSLWLRGMVGRPDGSEMLFSECKGPMQQAEEIGTRLGEDLLAQGARAILESVHSV